MVGIVALTLWLAMPAIGWAAIPAIPSGAAADIFHKAGRPGDVQFGHRIVATGSPLRLWRDGAARHSSGGDGRDFFPGLLSDRRKFYLHRVLKRAGHCHRRADDWRERG